MRSALIAVVCAALAAPVAVAPLVSSQATVAKITTSTITWYSDRNISLTFCTLALPKVSLRILPNCRAQLAKARASAPVTRSLVTPRRYSSTRPESRPMASDT